MIVSVRRKTDGAEVTRYAAQAINEIDGFPFAVLATADTLAALLDQCQTDYRAMAEVADGHANDARTLMEAWPK